MKSRINYCFPLLVFLVLCACEKQFDWNFIPVEHTGIVVDGIITNELIPQCIRLSLTNREMNNSVTAVTGAEVFVSDSLNIFEFAEPAVEPGSYYSEPFQVIIDRNYRLTIVYEGDTFMAVSEAVAVTSFESLTVALDDSTDLYRLLYTESSQPSMTDVFYDWSHDEDYCRMYGNCYAKESYYTLDNIDVNAVFSPPRKTIYFPHGTTLVRRKYGLSDAHQEFIRSLLMETDWSGGIFDVQHGNVTTNLSNGALGFFAACMVISDTTRVE